MECLAFVRVVLSRRVFYGDWRRPWRWKYLSGVKVRGGWAVGLLA